VNRQLRFLLLWFVVLELCTVPLTVRSVWAHVGTFLFSLLASLFLWDWLGRAFRAFSRDAEAPAAPDQSGVDGGSSTEAMASAELPVEGAQAGDVPRHASSGSGQDRPAG